MVTEYQNRDIAIRLQISTLPDAVRMLSGVDFRWVPNSNRNASRPWAGTIYVDEIYEDDIVAGMEYHGFLWPIESPMGETK